MPHFKNKTTGEIREWRTDNEDVIAVLSRKGWEPVEAPAEEPQAEVRELKAEAKEPTTLDAPEKRRAVADEEPEDAEGAGKTAARKVQGSKE